MVLVGEVGLSGELRAVSQLEARLKEARKLGFRRCIVPRLRQRQSFDLPDGLELIGVRSLQEAIDAALLPRK
jgi:DNA repair protein RadA/Sms